MKLSSAFVALICTVAAVDAGSNRMVRANRHNNLAHRADPSSSAVGSGSSRKCTRRHSPTSVQSSATHAPTTSSAAVHQEAKADPTTTSSSHKAASTSAKPKSTSKASSYAETSGNSGNGGSCSNKAAGDISASGGPNGSQKYLNCGIDDGGWNPPNLNVKDLAVSDLNDVRNKAFKPCTDETIDLFYKYGDAFGVPPILLASFAMQESSCNPKTVGGGGEQGIMQISKDKCEGRSPSACQELDFNIKAGAKYFSDQLKANGGNVVLTVGAYNGYYKGMTKGDATKAAKSSCCRCQQNLDYLQQFFNGWLQGYSAYDSPIKLGTYFNLDVCGSE
ncbi:glycoside hydrolase family 23 protein [Peniophora sp. CONT]|nr:glycoside hydrolase family 23 protein [Peniophora sp. CONT]